MDNSNGVALIWQIAAGEAVWKRHEFIKEEHVFIALCKVHSMLTDPEIQKELDKCLPVAQIIEEVGPIVNTFSSLNLQQDIIRRRVRALLGEGNYNRKEKEVIHRSADCKKLFTDAEEIARKEEASQLMPIHLMKALLAKPTGPIVQALEEHGSSPEELLKALGNVKPADKGPETVKKRGATPYIDRFCLDLTQQARDGKLKPLVHRRDELLQVVRILLRTSKSNPVLIGEAGVGKTAIVHGLAQRIIKGNIYPELRDLRVVELSLSSLVAGTRYRGEFEERLEGIINELKRNPDVIIFIDEIHSVVGAGGAEGALDAASILKPTLANGEIRCIGATTITEYRRWIEKDSALARRFQTVMIDEPSEEEALKIIYIGLKEMFEKKHKVTIEDDAIKASVELSVRYLVDKRLPDKAITVLEDACISRKVMELSFYGEPDHGFNKTVDRDAVEDVISKMTGIAKERISFSMGERILKMEGALKEKIVGQDSAIRVISQYMKRLAVGLHPDEDRPGAFLFVGPTGVGKTATAKAMAEFLFDSEDNLIRIDMSEYMEKHSVAKLIGSPPGYIGYEEEGFLTSRLRTKPYSVVLLDEVEKAHPDVLNLFLQVFDEGRLTDNKGRHIDARHSIFVMTSNIGSELYAKNPVGFQEANNGDTSDLWREITREVKKYFRPEFLNRVRMVFFRSLGEADITKIARSILENYRKRFTDKGISLKITDEALEFICEQGYEPVYGVRHLNRAIDDIVIAPISDMILRGKISNGMTVQICLEGKKLVFRTGNCEHNGTEEA